MNIEAAREAWENARTATNPTDKAYWVAIAQSRGEALDKAAGRAKSCPCGSTPA